MPMNPSAVSTKLPMNNSKLLILNVELMLFAPTEVFHIVLLLTSSASIPREKLHASLINNIVKLLEILESLLYIVVLKCEMLAYAQ